MKKTVLIALYAVLPLILAAAIYSSNPGYYGSSGLVPMALGAFAYTWLNMQLVLSSKPKWLDSVFGMDRIYKFHGLVPIAAIILALVHKLLNEAVFGESIKTTLGDIALFVFTALGVLALVFIADTLSRRIKVLGDLRERCRKIKIGRYDYHVILHNLNFAALAVIFIHVMLSYSAQNPLVMALYILYFVIAAYSYFYHKIISRYLLKKGYTVTEAIKESSSVITLKLKPEAKGPVHRPGQFGFLRVFGEPVSTEEHPFSISSAPGNETVDVTIKSNGDWTLKAQDIKPGAKAWFDAPYGRFDPTLYNCSDGAVFIAGGIGITPILSILRYFNNNPPEYKSLIFWAVNREDELIRRDEIVNICNKTGIVFVPVVADKAFNGETGYLTERIIKKYVEREGFEVGKLNFFFCGPTAMWPPVKKALEAMGIRKKMIRNESFSL